MKALKKIFTICGIIAILIVGIAVISELMVGDKETTATSTQSSGEKSATTTKAPENNKPTITKAEFDKIENGMTYEEVSKLIGGPGEVLSETGQKGDPLFTVMYMYKGEGDIGANANFMFQGGKLQSKAQMGLK